MAQHMGMTMNQLVEFMKAQLRKPEEQASSSSSGMPPPPPPPSMRTMIAAAEKSRSPYKPTAKAKSPAAEPPAPKQSAPIPVSDIARSRSAVRGRDPTPISISTPPRAVSVASTIAYDDQQEVQGKLARSRSKARPGAAAEELVLPIQEGARGRSPTNKVDRIISAIAQSQNKALVKGKMRHELGNFASRVQASRLEKRATKRAATADHAPSRVKTFDEIIDLAETLPSQGLRERSASAVSIPSQYNKGKGAPIGREVIRRRLK
jgi:hypothetical protein